jgi:MFS family permease
MTYFETIRQLPSQSFYMAAGSMINRMGSAVLVFLVLYLHNYKGATISFAGIVFASYGVGAFFAGPFSGWLSDKYGAHIVCISSLFFSGALGVFFPFIPLSLLIPFAIAWGAIGQAYIPSSQVIISHLSGPEQRKLAFSLNRLGQNIGMSVAPLLGSLLFTWHPNAIFYLDGVTSVGAAFFIYKTLWPHLRKNPIYKDSEQQLIASLKIVWKDMRLLNVVLATVFTLFVFFQLLATLSLFMVDSLHLTTTLFGMICLLNTLMVIFIELPLNIKMKDTPFHLALAAAALFMGCGFGIYYFAHGILLLASGAVLWSFGEMILFPTVAAYIFEITPADYRGAYMGVYSVGINIAFIFGPLLGTLWYSHFGRSIWLMCFIVGSFSAWLFYRLGRYALNSRTSQKSL